MNILPVLIMLIRSHGSPRTYFLIGFTHILHQLLVSTARKSNCMSSYSLFCYYLTILLFILQLEMLSHFMNGNTITVEPWLLTAQHISYKHPLISLCSVHSYVISSSMNFAHCLGILTLAKVRG